MFKIQFRRKKFQPNAHYSDIYQDHYPNDYPDADTDPFYMNEYNREVQNIQDFDACVFCGDVITSGHLVLTTNKGEHCVHTSCILSAFALITNSFSALLNLLFRRKGK